MLGLPLPPLTLQPGLPPAKEGKGSQGLEATVGSAGQPPNVDGQTQGLRSTPIPPQIFDPLWGVQLHMRPILLVCFPPSRAIRPVCHL